jgi:hypothetical protein
MQLTQAVVQVLFRPHRILEHMQLPPLLLPAALSAHGEACESRLLEAQPVQLALMRKAVRAAKAASRQLENETKNSSATTSVPEDICK